MADHTQMDPTRLKDAMGAIPKSLKLPTPPEPVGEILCSKDSEEYPMNYGKIGLCYIFNHKTFKSRMKLDDRNGTDVDAVQLQQLFTKLNFDVDRFNDYTDDHILWKLEEVGGKDLKKYSCFVCCILSYGTDDGKLCANKGDYPIQRIYERFYADKCISLSGKPKIFFIQACPCSVKKPVQQSTDFGRKVSFKIPINADFLVVYSTVPGMYSWENSNKGSWFIDALCSTITKHIGNMDLLQLLSIVNHKMAIHHKSKKLKMAVPCVTSTLTRDIKLPVGQLLESKLVVGDALYALESRSLDILKKGKVYIFNHKVYQRDRNNDNSRIGTERDGDNLEKIFEKLKFDVDVFLDKSKDFILKKLQNVADESHEKYSCFVCCILTHGDYGTLEAFDGSYEIEDIFSTFYDKWVDKPKIFFIQACQGKQAVPSFKIVEQQKQSTDSARIYNHRHLTHPDFLIVFSTAPGYFAFRNKDGSWFVQELFKVFNKHSKHKDFLQVLTITNRQVANEHSSNCSDSKERHLAKQSLCLTSTLTQNIDFGYPKQNN